MFAVRGPRNQFEGPTLLAFDSADGSTLWSHALPAGPPGSRALPAYDAGTVFLLDGDGGLQALDAVSGALRWTVGGGQRGFVFAPPVADGGDVFLNLGGTLQRRARATGRSSGA